MPHVADVKKASKVTVLIYNHMAFLSWLRRRNGWKEIIRLGVTRFATFITLKNIYDHKLDLQALVIDKHFTSHRLQILKLEKLLLLLFWITSFGMIVLLWQSL